MIYNKKVLITGTTGMLGKQFLSFLKAKNIDTYSLNRKDGNLLDFNFVKNFVLQIKPDIVIHCLADTNLKRCQDEQEKTLLLHCGLTHCLSSFDSKVIYISSSSVIKPNNFYSKTKLLGEKICLLNSEDNLVIRTNIYGTGSSSGKSLFEWAYNNFCNKTQVVGYSDVFFNPIYTKQLIRCTLKLIENNHKGVVNIAGDYKISKYQFLKKICDIFNFDKSFLIEGKSSFNDNVKRTKNTVLSVQDIKDEYNITLDLDKGLLELKNDMEKK